MSRDYVRGGPRRGAGREGEAGRAERSGASSEARVLSQPLEETERSPGGLLSPRTCGPHTVGKGDPSRCTFHPEPLTWRIC